MYKNESFTKPYKLGLKKVHQVIQMYTAKTLSAA